MSFRLEAGMVRDQIKGTAKNWLELKNSELRFGAMILQVADYSE